MKQLQSDANPTTYEIFIGILSILSIFNLVLYYTIPSEDVSVVVVIMDALLTLIFLADFVFRLVTAKSKSSYLLHEYGWADFLGSMPAPQFKFLRLFRVTRIVRIFHKYGSTGFLTEFIHNRARSALLTVLLFVIFLLEFGGMAILSVEQYARGGTIKTGADAIWYIFVTITTVGYGDTYPVTDPGRLIGMLIMAVGVALVGTLTGFLANVFLGAPGRSEQFDSERTPGVKTAERVDGEADLSAGGVAAHRQELAVSMLAELKQLLAEQQVSQATFARKVEEIESLLG